jgi:enterochelin esterase-like enzyme
VLKVCGALIALILAALGGTVTADAGELRHEALASTALGREMHIAVYVPDGYQAGTQDYPVLYLLHGAGGDENAWVERGGIQQRADRLIAGGVVPPMLIVMPRCRECWWVDGAKDKAETAFWTELVPTIAKRYRTIESRGGMLLGGLSAGGYGAVRFAMKYPDRIAAVAAFSPAVYSVTPPTASSARTQPPFLMPDGQFDQGRWAALNYPNMADRYFGQSFRVPFYLVSGDGDRFGIAFETALLFKRLFDRQPDITELRIVDGDHSWAVWANATDDALKYLARFAARPQVARKPIPQSAPVVAARPH